MKKSTVAWMSLIVLSAVCVGMSDAAIDSKTAEVLLLFDEGSGGVAKDASGNGNNAEVSGAQWVDGPFGKALEYDGVDKAYAVHAGRELRVIVESSKVADGKAEELAFAMSQKIQDEMTYPGQVKVTVIRETRAVSFAK